MKTRIKGFIAEGWSDVEAQQLAGIELALELRVRH
jgi:hypothetical protein